MGRKSWQYFGFYGQETTKYPSPKVTFAVPNFKLICESCHTSKLPAE